METASEIQLPEEVVPGSHVSAKVLKGNGIFLIFVSEKQRNNMLANFTLTDCVICGTLLAAAYIVAMAWIKEVISNSPYYEEKEW